MSFTMSAFLITWLAIALLAFAMSGLVRQVHALASSRQAVPFRTGPPIGAVLPDLNGAFQSHIQPNRPFCCSPRPPARPAPSLLPELARLASEHREMIQVGVVFRGRNGNRRADRCGVRGSVGAVRSSRDLGSPLRDRDLPQGVVLDAQLTGSVALLRQLVNAAVAGTTEG